MTIDFQKLVEFNNKHPDNTISVYLFILVNMIVSEDTSEEIIKYYIVFDRDEFDDYRYLESMGLIKITGEGLKDVSIRDLGMELIGQSKSDSIIELADKIREMFPKGVKSGGGYVRSEVVDIAEKLRKFFKKHKYTQEQVLEATKRYVDRKRIDDYAFMHQATYFIEKNNVSVLATECGNLTDTNNNNEVVDIIKRL